MYTQVLYDLGDIREIQKYYPGNYGAPGQKREKKRNRTPEEIRKQNQRNKVKKVQRLLIANFREGDISLTLTYKKELRPENLDQADKLRKDFLSRMRRAYKRAGEECKYVGVTEIGSKGAVHHHIIINNPEGLNVMKLVQRYWTHGHGYLTSLYEDGQFEKLSEYLLKNTGDEKEEDGKRETRCSYTRSRNLIIPEPQREKIHRRRWRDPPHIPKGWELLPETLYNGLNPVTHYPYQHYMIRRTDAGQSLFLSDNTRAKKAKRQRHIHPGGNPPIGPPDQNIPDRGGEG